MTTASPSTTASGHAVTQDREARTVDSLAIDLIGSVLLAMLAVSGMQFAFGGTSYLVIALVGAVAGAAVGAIVAWRHLGLLAAMALGVVVFVVASGPAVSADAIGGILPGPGTPAALLYGLVHGWRDLITTAPPAGAEHGMGVVPYVCAFAAALAAVLVARRTTSAALPAAPSLAVLVIAALLGTNQVPSILVQGSLWSIVALGWGGLRANRAQRIPGDVDWQRGAAAIVMLAVTVVAGLVVASVVPTHSSRTALRDDYEPPFDPRDYPSPLGAFRSYVIAATRENTFLTVRGLPKGEPIRIATMDTYDGVVWTVGADDAASGEYIRVGNQILPTPPGRAVTVQVDVGDYSGPWVPSVGATGSVRFSGPRAEDQEQTLRYNRITGSSATSVHLNDGDQYELAATIPATVDRDRLVKKLIDPDVRLPAVPKTPTLTRRATEIVGDAVTPYDKADRLEKWFASGYYSDGADKDDRVRPAPGHSLFRLNSFFEKSSTASGGSSNLVGNAEQYAAGMALMARSIGLPARVVMGFRPKVTGTGTVEVQGRDLDAWVEIAFDEVGWVPFQPTPDHNRKPRDLVDPPPETRELAQQEPPPPTVLVPPEEVASQTQKPPKLSPTKPRRSLVEAAPVQVLLFIAVLTTPIWLALLVVGLVSGLKSRRRRRRASGAPADRVAGAWAELIDRARDRGVTVSQAATRREVARSMPTAVWTGAPSFAGEVDTLIFGPGAIEPAAADRLWSEVGAQLRAMDADLTWRQRLRATCSLRSFRRPLPARAAP